MENLILMVEDNDDDVIIIERGFKKSNIANNYHRVINGAEALDFLEKTTDNIDLILLDLNMEVMNGFEFLKKRQEIEKIKKIPVIVLTSSHRQADIDLAYSLGANCYVKKPVDPKEFIAAIISIKEFWIILAKKPL